MDISDFSDADWDEESESELTHILGGTTTEILPEDEAPYVPNPLLRPLKGMIRSKGKDRKRQLVVWIDKLEFLEMKRLVRSNEDPRYNYYDAYFLRNAIAEAIEAHQRRMNNGESYGYTSHGILEVAKGIEDQRLIEEEAIGKFKKEMKELDSSAREAYNKFLFTIYRETKFESTRNLLEVSFKDLEKRWPV